ncbi:hypothetical protein V2G26_020416 [Clonostachys chloroleuca]
MTRRVLVQGGDAGGWHRRRTLGSRRQALGQGVGEKEGQGRGRPLWEPRLNGRDQNGMGATSTAPGNRPKTFPCRPPRRREGSSRASFDTTHHLYLEAFPSQRRTLHVALSKSRPNILYRAWRLGATRR